MVEDSLHLHELLKLPVETRLRLAQRLIDSAIQPARPGLEKQPPPYIYPTVPLPVSALDGLIAIMPPVGGDALADTEALDDDV